MYVRRFGQGKQILASVPAVLQSQDSVMEIKLISYLHLLLKLEKCFFSYQGIFLQAQLSGRVCYNEYSKTFVASRNTINFIQASQTCFINRQVL